MPKDLGLCEYQDMARKTAVYDHSDYPLLAMSEEVGEVMGKIAKYGRKNSLAANSVINQIANGLIPELKEQVEKEMGDVLWQWSNLCWELGLNPSDVAEKNISKLLGRQERGTLNGEGDER